MSEHHDIPFAPTHGEADYFARQASEGVALAATVAGDPGAGLAAAGLSPALREVACAVARELSLLNQMGRRQEVARLAHSYAGPLSLTDAARLGGLPHRARALVRSQRLIAGAAEEPSDVPGRPALREGFAADPGLRSALRRALEMPLQPDGPPARGEALSRVD
ncbi:MAG: hypothetical protein MJD61_03135 [Proteobacteria bacterium]|nr:hypothetical protein [Pseudomonadota bacterium]